MMQLTSLAINSDVTENASIAEARAIWPEAAHLPRHNNVTSKVSSSLIKAEQGKETVKDNNLGNGTVETWLPMSEL